MRAPSIALAISASAAAMAFAPAAAQTVGTPAAPAPTPAPAPPDVDLFVADLVHEAGAWRIERPRNVTKRVGYDNQPWFLADGQKLLYTSQREGKNGTQTDIYELDLATATERQVTATPESEYSPQLAADGASIVVVRVEDAAANEANPGSAQRLWRFPLQGGGAPALVAPEVRGVGYHAWADAETVAVFVLGDPFTLQLIEPGGAAPKVVASGVGRSIHRVPGRREVSYTAPQGDARAIFAYDVASGESHRIAPAPPTEEGDYAWTPDGALLASVGSTIHRLRPGVDAEWIPIGDFAGDGVGKISRLAVSPMGNQIVFVAEP